MKWTAGQFVRQLEAQMQLNVSRAADVVTDRAWERVGRQYPPASKRGESPARRTANLQRHIKTVKGDPRDIDEQFSAFTVSDGLSSKGFPYPAHLELNMDRAFLVPSLDESADAIVTEMTRDDILNSVAGVGE